MYFILQGTQFINIDTLNAQQNTTSVLNMEPVIAIGDAQAAIPALDGKYSTLFVYLLYNLSLYLT